MISLKSKIETIQLSTDWPVGPVNVFLVYGEKLTLVDAGRKLGKAWDEFNTALKALGLNVKDIEQIVLTHHHGDHVGLLEYILDANPIPVYAHANCRPYLTKDVIHSENTYRFFKGFYTEFGLAEQLSHELASFKGWDQPFNRKIDISKDLNEGEQLPGLTGWRVIDTKGHAQSHISLYNSVDKVLIAGDHLIKHIPAGIFLEPPIEPETERSRPLIQYVDNLKKLVEYPIQITLSGHGEPIDNSRELINETLEKIDKRAARVRSMLLDGKKNGYQLVKKLYPGRFEGAMTLLASDTIGLLDLLEDRGEIVAQNEDGVIYYST
ncbi:MBL fold metallo-hydrolase [Bacillus sp. T33-2]|uniref:MBL fold metallo-hydrolase n=1 Tax=Bacillus sp. T33-2 TaxID=2054168 RepID=UPI0015E0EEF6|nr:MBL fold metallo-hydrolase [Bacillus sp. T33-2]